VPKSKEREITIKVSETVYSLLEVLARKPRDPTGAGLALLAGSVEEVVELLVDHAQQGVYRPGAWERAWLCQVFGDDWLQHMEVGDPYGRPDSPMFQRPRKRDADQA
jgi:hypothetical protein